MKTTFNEFKIISEFTGNKRAGWDSNNTNSHIITVTNMDTGKEIKFDFWGSIAEPKIVDEDDLLSAFNCFVSDAFSALDGYEYFCREFGYDFGKESERVYNACENSLEDLQEVYDGDVYELLDMLSQY